jgi:hypothetical protein
MLLTRCKRLAVLTAAVVVLSAFVSAGAAGAAPAVAASGERAAVEQAAPRAPLAPTCVTRFYHDHIAYKEVHLYNGCSGTRYVKVIVAYGPDSACIRLIRGASDTFRWFHGWPYALSRFDRLESC